LRIVAGILAAEARRPSDLAARYGVEEFTMLVPNTDAAGCARIAERVRRARRAAAIPHAPNQSPGLVTASIGGAICRPGVERSAGPALLIEAADRALCRQGCRPRPVGDGGRTGDLSLVVSA
jgi:diguanylate cyclase (GGDEF)-like protein